MAAQKRVRGAPAEESARCSAPAAAGRAIRGRRREGAAQRKRAEEDLRTGRARLQRESERLLALHRAASALAAQTGGPEAVIKEVLRSAVTLLGASSGSVYRWDSAADLLRCVYNWQVPASDITPDVRAGEGLAGQTYARGEPIIVNDYSSWEFAMESGRAGGLRAGLGVPLSRAGKSFGVLLIRSYHDDSTRFTEEDARVLTLFGDQAAAALFTAEAFEQQRRVAQRREALLRLARQFAAEGNPEQLLTELLEQAVALLEADTGTVRRWDAMRRQLLPVRTSSAKPVDYTPSRLGVGASGRAAERRATVIMNDYQRECGEKTVAARAGARAVVAAPLLHEGRLLGALVVHSFSPDRRFTAEDADVLEVLASIAAATLVGLERARLAGVLLAARTAQHELANQLTLTSGYAEMLARAPAMPIHLQEAAVAALRGAERAGEMLQRLQRITHLEEKAWGPLIKPTIDLGRSRRGP